MTIEKILDYVTKTPGNTNRAVLRSMINSLEITSQPLHNLITFSYRKVQNTDMVRCVITSDDVADRVACVIQTITTDGAQSLLVTDWYYVDKPDVVPEDIINYYNLLLISYLPIEVYSTLLQFILDNNTIISLTIRAPHFQEQSQDSSTFDPDTPLQPPEQDALT